MQLSQNRRDADETEERDNFSTKFSYLFINNLHDTTQCTLYITCLKIIPVGEEVIRLFQPN